MCFLGPQPILVSGSLANQEKFNTSAFFIISPYMGPLLAAFMLDTQPWPVPFWVYTAETAACLILIIFFLEETYYDRAIPAAEQPPLGSRVGRLVGVVQWRSRHLLNSLPQACWRVASVLLKPTIFLSCIYYMMVRPFLVSEICEKC